MSVVTEVKVKPLDWQERGSTHYADSVFGTYSIWVIGDSCYLREPDGYGGNPVGATLEDGKEAALKSIAARIRSALAKSDDTVSATDLSETIRRLAKDDPSQILSLVVALENAFLAGFLASAEGYNGEYPFEGKDPRESSGWVAVRNRDLASLIRGDLNNRTA